MATWPKMRSDRWFVPELCDGVPSTTVTNLVAERMNLFAVQIYRAGTIEGLGIYKTTTNARAHIFQMGVYETDGNGYPGELLADFGTVSQGAVQDGIKSVAGVAAVTPGLYYIAIKVNTVASNSTEATVVRFANTAGYRWMVTPPTGHTATGGFQNGLRLDSQGTGALPADLTGETFLNAATTIPTPYFTFEAAPEVTGAAGWGWHSGQPGWSTIF